MRTAGFVRAGVLLGNSVSLRAARPSNVVLPNSWLTGRLHIVSYRLRFHRKASSSLSSSCNKGNTPQVLFAFPHINADSPTPYGILPPYSHAVNDAAALAQSEVGLAVQKRSEVAVNSASVVLAKNSL